MTNSYLILTRAIPIESETATNVAHIFVEAGLYQMASPTRY